MDVTGLASATIGLIAEHLIRASRGGGQSPNDALAADLLSLIETEIDGDDFATMAFSRLRERPDDVDVRSVVERIVEGELKRKPHLSAAVSRRLPPAEATAPPPAIPVSTTAGRDVHISGIHRAQVALGPITNTRQFRLQIVGAGGALVAGVLAWLLVGLPVTHGQPPFSTLPFISNSLTGGASSEVSGPISRQGQFTITPVASLYLERGYVGEGVPTGGGFPDLYYVNGTQLVGVNDSVSYAWMAPVSGTVSSDTCSAALSSRRDGVVDTSQLKAGSWLCVHTLNGLLAAIRIVAPPDPTGTAGRYQLVFAYVLWQPPAASP